MAQQVAYERLFLKRNGFLEGKVPFHKAVHAAAAFRDVLLNTLFKSENRCGCLLVTHQGSIV
jgi:hypothetical protein